MEIIIYDTEFTTWEGAMEADWSREGEAREIVQFSAVKLGFGQQVSQYEQFDYLVKPQKNKTLSEYFSNLTGITQQQVERFGIENSRLLEYLKAYSRNGDIAMFSWGNDIQSIMDTAQQCNQSIDWVRSYDLREMFRQAQYDVSHVNSGNLYKQFGIDILVQEHNAMDDVKSLVASIDYVFKKTPKEVIRFFESVNK